MATDELGERLQRAVSLMTVHLDRDSDGTVDTAALTVALGPDASADDLLRALSDVMLLTELVLWSHWKATQKEPRQVLQEIALHQEG